MYHRLYMVQCMHIRPVQVEYLVYNLWCVQWAIVNRWYIGHIWPIVHTKVHSVHIWPMYTPKYLHQVIVIILCKSIYAIGHNLVYKIGCIHWTIYNQWYIRYAWCTTVQGVWLTYKAYRPCTQTKPNVSSVIYGTMYAYTPCTGRILGVQPLVRTMGHS